MKQLEVGQVWGNEDESETLTILDIIWESVRCNDTRTHNGGYSVDKIIPIDDFRKWAHHLITPESEEG